MTAQICPCCGCNLKQFDHFVFGNVAIDDCGKILFEGREMKLPKTQHLIVQALIRAKGRGLTQSVLANVLDGDVNDVTIVKYIERVRTSFRAVSRDFEQIVTLNGFGAYRWSHKLPAPVLPARSPRPRNHDWPNLELEFSANR